MIRLVYALRRLPNLSREEFQRYWRETHGPLVRQHATPLRILRYMQVHTIEDPLDDALRAPRGAMESYDGVAECWWKDREDLAMAFTTPEGQRVGAKLLEDERRFIDLSRSSLWIAKEHVIIEGEPGRVVAAEGSPVIKLVFVLRRLPHLSREEFQQYWRETHGALAQQLARSIRMCRYVQVHTIDDPLNDALRAPRGAMESYDGVAECWWKDREDLTMAFTTPEGQRAGAELLEDERRFIDLSRSSLWIAKEHVIIDGAPGEIVAMEGSPIIKLVFVLRRLPHLSREEFQRYWRETHGALAQQLARSIRMCRYVQVHTIEDPLNDALRAPRGTMEPYDGVAEAWWKDRKDLDMAFATPEGQPAAEEALEDERRFIDLPRCAVWFAKEHVIIDG